MYCWGFFFCFLCIIITSSRPFALSIVLVRFTQNMLDPNKFDLLLSKQLTCTAHQQLFFILSSNMINCSTICELSQNPGLHYFPVWHLPILFFLFFPRWFSIVETMHCQGRDFTRKSHPTLRTSSSQVELHSYWFVVDYWAPCLPFCTILVITRIFLKSFGNLFPCEVIMQTYLRIIQL